MDVFVDDKNDMPDILGSCRGFAGGGLMENDCQCSLSFA